MNHPVKNKTKILDLKSIGMYFCSISSIQMTLQLQDQKSDSYMMQKEQQISTIVDKDENCWIMPLAAASAATRFRDVGNLMAPTDQQADLPHAQGRLCELM